jgi:hypothetical protein
MKPLILVLLVTISVQAQTLVDAAKQERARQAKLKSTRVFTDQNAHVVQPLGASPPAAKPPAPAAENVQPAVPPVSPATPAPATSANDEQIQKARARLRALEDQETAVKLQINDLTNQVYAPVTDQTTKDQALNKLGDAMTKLTVIQRDIDQARISLQELEAKPAAKK